MNLKNGTKGLEREREREMNSTGSFIKYVEFMMLRIFDDDIVTISKLCPACTAVMSQGRVKRRRRWGGGGGGGWRGRVEEMKRTSSPSK